MLDKDMFAELIKSQFNTFESVANGIYWIAIRQSKFNWMGLSKYNPQRELKSSAESLLRNVETMADSLIGQYQKEAREIALEQKAGFLKAIEMTLAASINSVLKEIRAESIKKATNQVQNNPVFAQINLKRMDSVGRSYNASYQVYLTSRHFAILVALQSDYVRFRLDKTALVDVIKANEVIKTISVEEMFSEGVLKLFHPNSNLRTQAHVTKTE